MKKQPGMKILLLLILFTVACQKEHGPNWKLVQSLKGDEGIQVSLSSDRTVYKVGEDLKFKIKTNVDGKLWLAVVNPLDEVSLVYPSGASGSGEIAKDTEVQIPPATADWGIRASSPTGKHLVVAVVGTGNIDISSILPVSNGGTTTKEIEVGPGRIWGAKTLVVDVKE